MPGTRETLRDVVAQVDATLLPGLYAAVSVDPDRERARLRAARRPFVEPGAGDRPTREEVGRTAGWVIDQARGRVAVLGGIAGIGGAVTVPPEAALQAVAALRLAQRLALVHGLDPRTDRGEMAVWQALAAGFELPLPGDGPVGMRVRELPLVLVRGVAAKNAGGALATAMMRDAAWRIGHRFSRMLPLPFLSSGLAALRARRDMRDVGERMRETLRRLAEAPEPDPRQITEAVEVEP